MKKTISIILTTLIVVLTLPLAFAAGTVEIEGNDTPETATKISVNNGVKGNINKSGDKDYYEFTTSTNGFLSLKFEHPYDEYGYPRWILSLCDSQMKGIIETHIGSHDMITTTCNIGLPAGKYYIRVAEYNRYSDAYYTVTVNFTATDAWETERNDSYDISDEISPNRSINGSLYHSGDIDYYRFTTPSSGYVSLTFEHKFFEDGYPHWTLALYDSQMKAISETHIAARDISTSTVKNSLPAGTYYVRIAKYNGLSNIDYRLTVNYSKDSFYLVTFDANGGTVTPTTSTVPSGSSVTLPTPQKADYICLGWSKSSNATVAEFKCGSNFKPSSDTTLYAVWQKDTGNNNGNDNDNGNDSNIIEYWSNKILSVFKIIWAAIKLALPLIISFIKKI